LKMLNELFQYARKHGAVKLEADIEETEQERGLQEVSQVPEQSPRASLCLRHRGGSAARPWACWAGRRKKSATRERRRWSGRFAASCCATDFSALWQSNMAKTNEAEAHFYRCLRVAIAAFVRRSAPILSIEFARRSIPA